MSNTRVAYPSNLTAPGAVDALIAYHRSVFGGARMQDDDGDDRDRNDDSRDGEQDEERPKPRPPRQQRRDEDDKDDRDDERKGGRTQVLADLANERSKRHAAEERAAAAEARATELERAQMSEQERTQAERDDFRSKYEQATATVAERDLQLTRLQVAIEKGIPAHAHRLHGTTREELERDADAFKAETRQKYIDPTASSSSYGQDRGGSMTADVDAYVAARTKKTGR